MKNKMKYCIAVALLAVLNFTSAVMAQPDPGQGTSVANQGDLGAGASSLAGGGASAPIGDGIYMLIALAMVYGISRWYAIHKQNSVLA